jgi:hypothetical protein
MSNCRVSARACAKKSDRRCGEFGPGRCRVRLSEEKSVDLQHGHLSLAELKVMSAIEQCRSAALGGHVLRCDGCGTDAIAYNSCRNRHCPKCQASAAQRWLEDRCADLLPVEYYHVVFTLPAPIAALAYSNKAVIYGLLFEVAAATLLTIAADPKHLGARIGATLVLHTWGSALTHHPHVHGIVPGGGIATDGARWIGCRPGFFLPVRVLSRLLGVARPPSRPRPLDAPARTGVRQPLTFAEQASGRQNRPKAARTLHCDRMRSMIEATWWLFVVASLVLIATPGQDMILVMSRSVAQGSAAGVVTAAGVSVGLVGHTLLATLGLGAILRTSEWLFLALKLIGAAYLVYLGVQLVRA